MRRLFFIAAGLGLLGFFIFVLFYKPQTSQKRISTKISSIIMPAISPSSASPVNIAVTKTLFVPYWTMGKDIIDITGYDQLVYFGVTVDTNGINTDDQGYKNLDTFFAKTTTSSKRLLGVRMINSDSNTTVLENSSLQKKIITETIQLAKDKGFDGVVLDFEISAIGFDTLTKEISNFETQFAASVKENSFPFYATVYGDTFVRLRPFDVSVIANASDGIMIMAYDYHKASGDAGPNFPLHGTSDDPYDMVAMISDFAKKVPAKKLMVIFGLYGYDWQLDDQKRSTGQAVALSDYKIQQKFLTNCQLAQCKITRDTTSAETEITYRDASFHNHVVWFEDMQSVEKKIAFLKTQGIFSFGYWAYSYF